MESTSSGSTPAIHSDAGAIRRLASNFSTRHPPYSGRRAARGNTTWSAYRLFIGNRSYLEVTDIDEKGIALLLGTTRGVVAEVLALPHYTRNVALVDDLIHAVRPRHIVISGSGSRTARSHAKRLEASGYRVFATWRRGAIVLRPERTGWNIEYWRDAR